MVDEAIKFDENKVRLELLPTDAIEAVADVLTFGAKKYGDHNWEKGFDYTRVIGSLLRHVFAFAKGEDLDPESGKSHLAHAACNVLFLLTFTLRGTGRDDRPKGKKADSIAGESSGDDISPCIFTKIGHIIRDNIPLPTYEWYWRDSRYGAERGPFKSESDARRDALRVRCSQKGLKFVDCAEGGDYGRLSGDKE